jgi:hypothetical protein
VDDKLVKTHQHHLLQRSCYSCNNILKKQPLRDELRDELREAVEREVLKAAVERSSPYLCSLIPAFKFKRFEKCLFEPMFENH